MEEVSDVTVEHLQTEPDDNGARPEGGRACSTVRSNLRKLNKSWPCRGFIIQHSGLLSCAVTEPGGAPLGMNSQSIASDLKHGALLSWQIKLCLLFILHVDSVVCELGTPVFRFPTQHYETTMFYKEWHNDFHCKHLIYSGTKLWKNNIINHKSCSDLSIETMLLWLQDDQWRAYCM